MLEWVSFRRTSRWSKYFLSSPIMLFSLSLITEMEFEEEKEPETDLQMEEENEPQEDILERQVALTMPVGSKTGEKAAEH